MSPLLCKLNVMLKIFLAFTSRLTNSLSLQSSTSTYIVRIGIVQSCCMLSLYFHEYNSDSCSAQEFFAYSLFVRLPGICTDLPPQAHWFLLRWLQFFLPWMFLCPFQCKLDKIDKELFHKILKDSLTPNLFSCNFCSWVYVPQIW